MRLTFMELAKQAGIIEILESLLPPEEREAFRKEANEKIEKADQLCQQAEQHVAASISKPTEGQDE